MSKSFAPKLTNLEYNVLRGYGDSFQMEKAVNPVRDQLVKRGLIEHLEQGFDSEFITGSQHYYRITGRGALMLQRYDARQRWEKPKWDGAA